jgi:hypothetical protein
MNGTMVSHHTAQTTNSPSNGMTLILHAEVRSDSHSSLAKCSKKSV